MRQGASSFRVAVTQLRTLRLMATSVTSPCIVSGSTRGRLPASGSPLGLPSVTSKSNLKSCRRSLSVQTSPISLTLRCVLVLLVLPDLRALLVLVVERLAQLPPCPCHGPVVGLLVVVAEREQGLVLERQDGREATTQALHDVGDAPIDGPVDGLSVLPQPGHVVLVGAQQRSEDRGRRGGGGAVVAVGQGGVDPSQCRSLGRLQLGQQPPAKVGRARLFRLQPTHPGFLPIVVASLAPAEQRQPQQGGPGPRHPLLRPVAAD